MTQPTSRSTTAPTTDDMRAAFRNWEGNGVPEWEDPDPIFNTWLASVEKEKEDLRAALERVTSDDLIPHLQWARLWGNYRMGGAKPAERARDILELLRAVAAGTPIDRYKGIVMARVETMLEED